MMTVDILTVLSENVDVTLLNKLMCMLANESVKNNLLFSHVLVNV